MASVYQLKAKFVQLLRPVSNILQRRGITPNQVTIAGVVLSVATGLVLVAFPSAKILLLFPLVMLVRMALNAIDGDMARRFNQMTPLGAALNEIGDVVADLFLFLPLMVVSSMPVLATGFFAGLATVSEMAGVVATQLGGQRSYLGPMGKSDRAVAISLLCVLLAFKPDLSRALLGSIMLLLNFMLVITIVRRVQSAL